MPLSLACEALGYEDPVASRLVPCLVTGFNREKLFGCLNPEMLLCVTHKLDAGIPMCLVNAVREIGEEKQHTVIRAWLNGVP